MRKWLALPGLALAICGVSCDDGPFMLPGPVTFTLAPGQSASSEGVRVTFMRVVFDSRCPQGLMCVTAGDAAIEVTLAAGSDSTRAEMRLNEPALRTLVVNSVSFDFQDLSPLPFSGRQLDPSEYRARIVAVSR